MYNKPFFVKTKQGVDEKIVKMSRNNDYIAANLLDYSYP